MDIDIDPVKLTPRTRGLLLDFQRVQLRHAMNEAMDIWEADITKQYFDIKRELQKCSEREIADIAVFNFEDLSKITEELDRICTALVESGQLKEDDYQEEFDRRLEQHWQQIKESEAALVRLSLKIKDVRPPFFKQIN